MSLHGRRERKVGGRNDLLHSTYPRLVFRDMVHAEACCALGVVWYCRTCEVYGTFEREEKMIIEELKRISERMRKRRLLSEKKKELARLRDTETICYNALREINEKYAKLILEIHYIEAQLRT